MIFSFFLLDSKMEEAHGITAINLSKDGQYLLVNLTIKVRTKRAQQLKSGRIEGSGWYMEGEGN